MKVLIAILLLQNVGEGSVDYTEAGGEAPCGNVNEGIANDDELGVKAPRWDVGKHIVNGAKVDGDWWSLSLVEMLAKAVLWN